MTTSPNPQLTPTTSHVAVATGDGLQLPGHGRPSPVAGRVTAVHADGPETWSLVDRAHLHRSGPRGVDHVASLDRPEGICLGVHQGTVWVGGDGARLWRLAGTRLEEVPSFPEAPSHERWHTPWGGPPAVFSMASDGTHLYVSVHVGGIMRTSDGGRTWEPTIDLHDDVHQVAVDRAGTLWAATGRRGLARSRDLGRTWSYHTEGLHATYLLAVAPVAAGVLVGASSGHAAPDGAVHLLAGDRFHRVTGLPADLHGAVAPRQLAAAGERAAVALPNGDVYASADGGRYWERVAEALPDVAEVTLRPDHRSEA